jgi:hypothetical protein
MQGKGLHPNSDSRTFWTPFWGIPFFSRPSPFLCNAFNRQVFRPYGGNIRQTKNHTQSLQRRSGYSSGEK